MTLTDQEKAIDRINAVIHAEFCGKLPGLEGRDLFGQHEVLAKSIYNRLVDGPGNDYPDSTAPEHVNVNGHMYVHVAACQCYEVQS